MNPNDFQSLIQRLLDGDLPAEEFAAIEAELLSNPEALETYRNWIDLHCGLQRQGSLRAAGENLPVVPIDRVLTLQRRRVAKISLVAAAAVVVVSAVALWLTMVPDPPPATASMRVAPGSSVHFQNEAADARGTLTLPKGRRAVIDHGAVELSLPHEVRAVVEAPAALTLLDDRELHLDYGRAFFEVPTTAGRGFTVVTARQRIVDLGTAFGVEVSADGSATGLHVFEGRVRIDATGGVRGETLTAPRSVRLDGPRVQDEFDGPATAFRRQLPAKVETIFVEDFESGLTGRREYAVRMDPTAIRDLAGNRFPGIDDDTTWRFTVAAHEPFGLEIDPARVVAGTPVGKLVVVDVPYQPTLPADGPIGPDWVEPADGGWRLPTGASLEASHGPSTWEPDGTSLAEALNYRLAGQPGSTYSFDLADGTVIHGIYATWSIRGKSGAHWNYREGAAADSLDTSMESGPGGDLVVVWIDETGTPHEGSFERLFPGPIPVVGGDGFTLTATRIANTHQADAVILDITPPATRTDAPKAMEGTPANDDPDPAGPDLTPPSIERLSPSRHAVGVRPGRPLTVTFDEPVRFGTGRILLRNLTDWIETELVVGSARTTLDGRVLTIRPPTNLGDGEIRIGRIGGWSGWGRTGILNPSGNGTWYADDVFKDSGTVRGAIGAMRGPTVATLGPGPQTSGIRRQIGTIAPNRRYTVSVAIGRRDGAATDDTSFPGYVIRLKSGDTVLAECTGDEPPGPPGSFASVGFSWDSADLPEAVEVGDALTVEIATGDASRPGQLDFDHIRVSVVEK